MNVEELVGRSVDEVLEEAARSSEELLTVFVGFDDSFTAGETGAAIDHALQEAGVVGLVRVEKVEPAEA